MKESHLDRRGTPRARAGRVGIALFSAVLDLGGSALSSHPSPGQTMTYSMAGMPRAQLPGAAAATGAIVELHQGVVSVSIHNFAFGPARLVVSPGARIVWTNQDSDPHTVTSTTGIWASEALDTGSQFARVFPTAGAFPYDCTIHPFMHGTIVVKS